MSIYSKGNRISETRAQEIIEGLHTNILFMDINGAYVFESTNGFKYEGAGYHRYLKASELLNLLTNTFEEQMTFRYKT